MLQRGRRDGDLCVGLDSLLEGAHLLDLVELAPKLALVVEPLFSLDAEVLEKFLFGLLERFHFFAKVFDLLALKLVGFSLKSVHCL